MVQSDPAPRALFVLRDGTGDAVPVPEPAPVPLAVSDGTENGPGTSTAPLSVPVQMTVPERSRLAARYWVTIAANGAGQMWLHPDRLLYVLWHGRPETMAEHRVYIKSRAWVPEELTGKWRKTVIFLGVAYHVLIARPVKAMARTVDAAAERPLRLALLAAFIISFAVFAVPHIPLA